MISCDFAPNEGWDDAWLALKLIFQPWRWKNGTETISIKNQLLKKLNLPSRIYNLRSIGLFLSGRSALYFLLKSLNLPKDTEIVVQAFTCEAVVLPILENGFKPVYVDIETKTFSMEIVDLKKKITDRARVLILQHSFGLTPTYRKEILDLAGQKNLFIIEDLAHGFSNFKFPTSSFGLRGTSQISNLKNAYLLSFGRSKTISSVFGGAIVTSNNQIANRLNKVEQKLVFPNNFFIFRLLCYKILAPLIKSAYDFYLGKIIHFLTKILEIFPAEVTEGEKKGKYNHVFDKAYPNALVILLSRQLKKFDQIQQKRAKICQIYQQKIFNSQFSIFNEFSNFKFQISNSPLSRYPMLVKNKSQLIDKAKKQNIFFGNWYDQPVGPRGLNLNQVQYKIGSCPMAEKVCQEIINLPTNISTDEAIRITKLWK